MSSRIKGITIEIGGDTTKLQTALKGVNSSLKGTQSSLKDVNRLLKLDPKNTDLLTQKQNLLKTRVQDLTQKLNTEKEALAQLATQDSTPEVREQQERLQREIASTENYLKSAEKELKEFGSVGAQQAMLVGDKFEQAGDKISSAGEKFMPISAAAGAAGVAAVKAATDFEQSLAKVQTLSGDAETKFNGSMMSMSDAILQLSSQTGVSTTEISEAVYQAISAGIDAGDAVQFVANSNALAEGGFTSLSTAVGSLTGVINAYGMSVSETQSIEDKLITTQNLGVTTVDELSGSMGKVIPTASALGVNIDNLCSTYVILTKNNIKAAEATTYTKGMLNELSKDGSNVSDILKEKTGKSFQELMESGKSLGDVMKILQESVGGNSSAFKNLWSSQEAGTAALALANAGADEFNGTLQKMADSAGAADAAAQKMEGTASHKLQVALNLVRNIATELGGTIMTVLGPALQKISDSVTKASEKFEKLSPVVQKIIVIVGMVVAAIGPVLLIVGKLVSGVGAVIKVVATIGPALATVAPVVLVVIGVIAALIAAGVAIYKNWDKIRAKAAEIKAAISEDWAALKASVVATVEAMKNGIVNKFTAIKTGITDKINAAKNAVKSAVDRIKSFFKFSWSLPPLKLPHFKLTGSFSLKKMTVPKLSVSWYGKGYNDFVGFDRATVLPTAAGLKGFGERSGREFVMSERKLRSLLGGTNNGNYNWTINVYSQPGQDANEIARLVQKNITDDVMRRKAVFA